MKQDNNTNTGLERESRADFPLLRSNFIFMAIAGIVIVAGFLLMLGGSSTEEAFNPDIFSTRRVVVGPTIAFIGFILMGVAIIYRPKEKNAPREANSPEA
ncbi:MAG: DUF3098 domain-containing protein [Pseudoflavonifractor sp.]|nr:DUF3098 domain-containing protein [Pseudoflavonifractor sp.]